MTAKGTSPVFDSNKNPVDRRFLLFQLDLSGHGVRQFTALNKFTAQRDSSNPGSNFKFIDPIDYEDVGSLLYWRNILNPGYKEAFKTQFTSFRDDFLSAVASGKVDLRTSAPGVPFRDISALVKKTSGFSVTAAMAANNLGLELGPTKSLADFNVLRGKETVDKNTQNSTFSQTLLDSDISENDVIMTRVSYDGGATYQLEYLGFITKVSTSRRYGSVDSMSLSVTGISKIFEINSVIRQASLRSEQFLPNIEVNDLSTPSLYETRFNPLDTKGIFETIMREVLALKPAPTADFADPNLLAFYNDNSILLNSDTATGFQFNLFVLLTITLMAQAEVKSGNPFYLNLFPKEQPGDTKIGVNAGSSGVLDSGVRAVVQHGEHQTYNLMIATGFENFFAQMDNAQTVFSEIRAHTFYDVFESRAGVIVCRPPRYNKLELTFGETAVDNLSVLDKAINRIFTLDRENKAWRLNPTADFYIRAEDMAGDVDVDKNDASLRTRVDTQFTMPTVGPQDYIAGSYTDPNLLVRYGLRTEGPINNPNALNPALATLFAPIALGIENAGTRTSKVKVWDTRPYQIGKLYYTESENTVGYCVGHDISHDYQKLGVSTLDLIMTRQVVDRPISEILKIDDEIVNFSMMYLVDPKATDKENPKAASAQRQWLLDRGREVLNHLSQVGSGLPVSQTVVQDQAVRAASAAISSGKPTLVSPFELSLGAELGQFLANQVTVPMFKYVPNILDLIIDVEDNPARIAPQTPTVDTAAAAAAGSNRRRQSVEGATTVNGVLYASELRELGGGLLYPENSFRDMGVAVEKQTPFAQASGFFPPVGAFKYSSVLPTDRTTSERGSINAVRTPVTVTNISELGAGVSFSQLLLNRLASFDLGVKYAPPGLQSNKYSPNTEGFPQYYGLVNGVYRLFGTFQDPGAYLKAQALSDVLGSTVSPALQSSLFRSPNALKFVGGGSTSEFSNDFFRIGSQLGSQFRMPAGHLVYRESLDNAVYSLRFIALSGGLYTITQIAPGQVQIDSSRGSKVFFDEGASGATSASFPGPGADDGTIIVDLSPATTVKLSTTVTASAPAGLYFISPFTDMTLERLLEFGLPPKIAGVRKSSDTATLIHTTNKALLGDKDQHVKGRGYDFAPELLTAGSGSDLKVLDPLFARVKTLLQGAGFHTDNIQSLLAITKNSLNITWTYLDGTPGTGSPMAAKVYYHVGVTDSEVAKDVQLQRPSRQSGPSIEAAALQGINIFGGS